MSGSNFCSVWNNQTFYPLDHRPICHLRGGIFSNEIMQFENDPNLYVCTSDAELIRIILRYLRCSFEFVVSNSNFGGDKVNGTWVGMMALLAQKKTDFVVHMFSNSGHRNELIYYDLMIPQEELVTILSSPKEVVFTNPLKIFNTFVPLLWLLILISFIVCGALHALNNRSISRSNGYCWRPQLYELGLLYVDMFGLSLGHGSVVLRGRTNLVFNPIYAYIGAILVLRQIFSGELTAILLSDDRVIYDRFDQLVEDSKVKFIMQHNSTSHLAFIKRYPQMIDRSVLVTFEDLMSLESLNKVLNSHYVIISPRNYAYKVFKNMAGWHISSEGFEAALINYPISKTTDPDRKRILARLFRHLHYFGLVSHIEKKIEMNRFRIDHRRNPTLSMQELATRQILKAVHNQAPTVKKFRASNLLTAVYIYTFGVLIGITTLCIEILGIRLQVFFPVHETIIKAIE